MRVIGTAGHVDHGKSTLVKALTGIDPDRLKEEKKRQMTIELGFAWFESQSEGEIGIVDVPGHRDFIDTMLAGVGGIDAVLLVIAADEGIMPQTKEHLAIIELLRVNTGLVVLTKVDLVDDPAWLELVEMDIRERLSSTCLENAPLLRVSAVTGDGIAQLRAAIEEVLAPLPPRLDLGRPRLPIDRIFSLTGFGTVVTGTLLNGSLCVDNEVEILPSRRSARIRGLQTHKHSETIALPGSRTAVNLSGVDVADIKRGEVITIPRMLKPTQRIDAQIELLQDA
ncbi:MAG TPA: selenocysteine-specific translation elongation factor, partial [Anaerolineaceae bacterium]|nr:selenocysteine-specific translation elongation factor [Anaerolineaceae bacterium]